MNRYLVFSGGLHAIAALFLLLFLAPPTQKAVATYTIDFIGSGKVVATTGQEASSGPAATSKEAVQTAQPATPATKPTPKITKKAYASKMEIAEKPSKKAATKPTPLATPSILNDTAETGSNTQEGEGADQHNAFGGGNIQTDFANFPYPWYITQVRNSLWIEWEKRRPAGNTLSAMVSFAIARDGKITNLKTEKKSGDDTFDFAATSAVINAGPFAPLPMYYEKDELTVTVEFKQEN